MSDKTGGSAAIGYDWRANSPHPDAIDPYGGPEFDGVNPDYMTDEQVALMEDVMDQMDHLPDPTTRDVHSIQNKRGDQAPQEPNAIPVLAQLVLEEATTRANVPLTISEADAAVIEAGTQRLAAAGIRTNKLDLHSYNGVDQAQWGRNLIGTWTIKDLPADVLAYADHAFLRGMGNTTTTGLRMARGERPDTVLAGPKARSFYNNIIDPEHDRSVTIDADMIRAMTSNPALSTKQAHELVANDTSYELFATAVRQAAEAQGLLPSQFQAAVSAEWHREHPR